MFNMKTIHCAYAVSAEEHVKKHTTLSEEQIMDKLNSGMTYGDIAIEYESNGEFTSETEYAKHCADAMAELANIQSSTTMERKPMLNLYHIHYYAKGSDYKVESKIHVIAKSIGEAIAKIEELGFEGEAITEISKANSVDKDYKFDA